jgi:hypothetical protein
MVQGRVVAARSCRTVVSVSTPCYRRRLPCVPNGPEAQRILPTHSCGAETSKSVRPQCVISSFWLEISLVVKRHLRAGITLANGNAFASLEP